MAQIPSQNCTFCSKLASLYCYDCQQCLCTQCQKNMHGIVAVCRDHKVGDIHKAGNRIYKPVPTCDVHNKEFLYYCSKCDCLTCKECVTNSHNGHITKEIKNIADIRRKDVDLIINTLKTKVKEIKETLKIIDESHSLQIQSDCDSYISNVEKTYQEIQQIIDRYRLINITTATDFREIEEQDLKRKRVFYQRLDNEYSDRLLKFENLLQEPHDGTFFTEWKGLQTELQIMTEESEQQVSGPRQIDRFNQDTFIRAVIEDFDNQFQMGIQSMQHEILVLAEKLKKDEEDSLDMLKKLKNEKQLVIDHFTQQAQSKDNEIQRLHGEIRQLSENNAQYEQFCRQTQEELQSFKSELERKEDSLQTVVKQRNEERTLKEDERKQKDEALTRLKQQELTFTKLNKEFSDLQAEIERKKRQQDDDSKEAADNVQKITTEFEDKTKLVAARLKTSQQDNYRLDNFYGILQKHQDVEENRYKRERGENLAQRQEQDLESARHNKEMVSKKQTQIRQDSFAGSMSRFQKQFMATKDLKVIVVQDDIINSKVDTIVCPQDENISNDGGIARAIEKVCDNSYKKAVKDLLYIMTSEFRKVKASPSSLPFQYVLQSVPPRYDKLAEANRSSFEKDLEKTIRNILRHCSDKGDVKSLAMPVLGVGKDGLDTSVLIFVKCFLIVLLSEIKTALKFDVKEIQIVTNDISAAAFIAHELEKEKSFNIVTSFIRTRNKIVKGNMNQNMAEDTKMAMAGKPFRGKLENGNENCIICMEPNTKPWEMTCGHIFCQNCIQEFLKVKPVCPTCGSIQGVINGDQPPGTMKRRETRSSLPGYKECGTIEIEYNIYGGVQGEEHPNPGKYFKGIKRVALLPNNMKGKLIANLLRIAFDRKLVFTIGQSRTTGQEGVVTWNDIYHKTSSSYGHQFGYPDEGYFDRVLDELTIKGVTEKDL